MDPPRRSSVPSLSVVVPSTGSSSSQHMVSRGNPAQHLWQPTPQTPGRTRNIVPAKQKRLFPIACRVVPLDLWFTTRVDRTWQIQDLKVWLLSKALPDSALTLPPSYRPSSPVTFAAPPPPIPVTRSHPSPPQSPQAYNGSPTYGLEISPPSPYDYIFDDDDDVSLYAPSYYTVDSIEDGRIRPMTPRSIPYSFSTGAPSISGLEALRKNNSTRTSNRTFPGTSDTKDPELWRRAMELAEEWCLYSFSTGMQLSEDVAISEYRIRPFELLELHRSHSYVQLPPIAPSPLQPLQPPSQPPLSLSSTAFRGSRFKPPSPPSPPRGPPVQDETESEEDEATMISRRLGGSPYAQPYFECYAWVLRNPPDPDELLRKAAKRRATRLPGEAIPLEESDPLTAPERWRKVWMTVKDGKLRLHKDRKDPVLETSYEIARCIALHGPDKLEELTGPIWQKRPPGTSASVAHKFAICARFRQVSMPKSKLKYARANKLRFQQLNQLDSTWLYFKVNDADIHENLLRVIHRLSYSSPIAFADSMSHTNAIIRPRVRSIVRHASTNTVISAAITSSLSLLHQRTLRTDFLPNPIPHPLSLRFSAPSPAGDSSPLSPAFNYNFDLDDDSLSGSNDGNSTSRNRGESEDEGLGGREGAGLGLGNGKGIGVRFPEWREEVVSRAIEAGKQWGELDFQPRVDRKSTTPIARPGMMGMGMGMGPAATSEGSTSAAAEVVQPEEEGELLYFGDYDSDEDDGVGSDTFSELEWDGWAYDLDRPKGGPSMGGIGNFGLGLKGLQTPNASPATDTDEEDDEGGDSSSKRSKHTIIVTRARAQSAAAESPTFSRASSSATVMALRSTSSTTAAAAGASSSSTTSPTAVTPTVVTPSTASSSGSASTPTRGRASTISVRSQPPSTPRLMEESSSSSSRAVIMKPHVLPHASSSSSFTPVVDVAQAQAHEGPPSSSSATNLSSSGTSTTGRKGLMRGFTMRVGKGLENALDFVEGK